MTTILCTNQLIPGAWIETVIDSQMSDQRLAARMESLTNETLVHFVNLVTEVCSQLTNSWGLVCCCWIDIVDRCLHKSEEMDQGLIIGQVEDIVGFEELIKCTQ